MVQLYWQGDASNRSWAFVASMFWLAGHPLFGVMIWFIFACTQWDEIKSGYDTLEEYIYFYIDLFGLAASTTADYKQLSFLIDYHRKHSKTAKYQEFYSDEIKRAKKEKGLDEVGYSSAVEESLYGGTEGLSVLDYLLDFVHEEWDREGDVIMMEYFTGKKNLATFYNLSYEQTKQAFLQRKALNYHVENDDVYFQDKRSFNSILDNSLLDSVDKWGPFGQDNLSDYNLTFEKKSNYDDIFWDDFRLDSK